MGLPAVPQELVGLVKGLSPFVAHWAVQCDVSLLMLLDPESVQRYRESLDGDMESFREGGVEAILALLGDHHPALRDVLDREQGRRWIKKQVDELLGDTTGLREV